MNVQTSSRHDPFLQRAIEYWLDSQNELGYQSLFCEWLITRGHVLKYSIKNTTLELGKDVVSVSEDRIPCAFQLKGGNINLNRWRTEVKPEIEVLIDCAIEHPDIDKKTGHISYLVTNGEIDDTVRVEIVALNEKRWKESPLQVWTRGDLLSGFQNMAEGILPKDAQTYKKLIDLMFTEGTGLPDLKQIDLFLSDIIGIAITTKKKEQRRRDIAAAVLYTNMIVGPYRIVHNHTAVVHIQVLLLSSIFHLVDKYSLDDKYWIDSYRIIWGDIIGAASQLERAINAGELDSAFTTPFDTDLIPFRKHLAVSTVYPLKLSQFITGNDDWKSVLDPQIAVRYRETILVWGEGAFLPFMFIALILKNIDEGKQTASNLVGTCILQILEHNGRNSKDKKGLIPPYYGIDFAVKLGFELLEYTFEDSYKSGSYLLKSLIEMMVRLGQRDFIAKQWRELSFMHFEEFVPDVPTDFYLWRASLGENLSILPKKEQSWKELEKQTLQLVGENLPATLRRFPEFIPFFLNVFPHRVTPETIGFLYLVSSRKI